MIFLRKTLRAASINAGDGKRFKDLPWYHKWNYRFSSLRWLSLEYWTKLRPLERKITKFEKKHGISFGK